MKRWVLRVYDINSVVVHEERFWRRTIAEKIGRFYTRPLPPFVTSETVGPRRRDGTLLGPMLTYIVSRHR